MLAPLVLSLLAAVDVRSETDCPAEADVLRELEALGTETEGAYFLEVVRGDGSMALRLFDAGNLEIAERALPATGTCTELASAAAVTAAAWLLELSPPVLDAPALGATPGDRPRADVVASVAAPAPRPGRAARHEAAFLFSTTLDDGYTSAPGAGVDFTYWLLDGVGLNLRVHGLDASESGLLEVARLNFPGQEPDFQDTTQLGSNFGVGAVLSIARAPATFFGIGGSEVEFLALAGAGAGATRRRREGIDESSMAAMGHLGAGLRFYVAPPLVALRVEIRDVFFGEQSETHNGFTHNLLAQIGLQVSTDPDAWSIHALPALDTPLYERRLVADLALGASVGDTFVTTRAAGLSVAYYFHDFLGVELAGNFLAPTESAMMRELLDEAKLTPQLSEITQLQWAVGAGIRADLFRGRFIPLGAAIDGDFAFHISLGAGAGGSRTQCTPGLAIDPEVFGAGATCPMIDPSSIGDDFVAVYEPTRSQLLVFVAAGARLGLTDVIGLHLGVRDWTFESTVRRPDTTEPSQRESSSRRHILLAELGLSIAL